MKDSKVNGQILKTDKYEDFKFREDNREITHSHVNTLIASLKQHNDMHLHPIVVNDEMEVLDGQHRLKACQKLAIPIYYVIDNDFDPSKLITMNTTQQKWNTDDYLKYYINHGNHNYEQLKSLRDDVGFTTSLMIKWLTQDGGGVHKSFRMGTFKFSVSEELLYSILKCKKFIEHLKSKNFKPEKIYTSGAFHVACKEFFTNPLVDYDRFFERLEIVPFTLRLCNRWQEYLDQFVEIYNYHMKKRMSVVAEGDKRELKIQE